MIRELPVLDRSAEAVLDDLLEYVEDGKVVPVIGEELLRVPLYGYIAGKLAERLQIPADALPSEPSLNAVVCHYLQTGGVPEEACGQQPHGGEAGVSALGSVRQADWT